MPDTAPNGDQDRITDSAAFDAAQELVKRKVQQGITAFAQDMRDSGIHVGMTLDGSVLCVNCGDTWPCEGATP